jgi:hypothetical protein
MICHCAVSRSGSPDCEFRPRLNRKKNPRRLVMRHRRYPVRRVNICDYFFLQGLVTWLDTSILSRTIQEVIDARQLV